MRVVEGGPQVMAEAQMLVIFSTWSRRTSYYLRNVRLLTISNYA